MSSDTDFGINQNESDWFGMNFNPKPSPGKPKIDRNQRVHTFGIQDDVQYWRRILFVFAQNQVFFRAGVLGQMEEFRDERLSKIVSWMQAFVRGYIARKDFKALQEQRLALQVVQRNLRRYLKLRTWPWWKLWTKVRPLLNASRIEDELAVSIINIPITTLRVSHHRLIRVARRNKPNFVKSRSPENWWSRIRSFAKISEVDKVVGISSSCYSRLAWFIAVLHENVGGTLQF